MLTLLFVSDRFEKILSQFSQAMLQAIHTSHPCCNQLHIFLTHIQRSGIQTKQLTEMAYKWCSAVCENPSILENMGYIPLLSLKIGFYSPDPKDRWTGANLTHTEHHQELARVVFSSGDGEAVADLLCAWTSRSYAHDPYPSLRICAEYLIGLHYLHPFSLRLRQYIIHAIELIGYEPFEQVGLEGFVGLLDDLQVCTKDTEHTGKWEKILLDTVQSCKETEHLSLTYYEWLVEFAGYWSDELRNSTYNPYIITSLESNREWDKLKCWIAVVWTIWPPEDGQTTVEDLKHVMVSLSHQQPGAVQELERQMRESHRKWPWIQIPESFLQIFKHVHNEAAQQATL